MSESYKRRPEICMDDIKLSEKQLKSDTKIRITGVSGETDTDTDFQMNENQPGKSLSYPKQLSKRVRKTCSWKTVLVVLMFIVLLTSNVYLLNKAINSSDTLTQSILKENPKSEGLIQDLVGGNAALKPAYHIDVGMRNDYRLQECQDTRFKQTFPDVDYALFGYNVLKGYPLATGHDPGFTYPIFTADYSAGRQTADCRYSIPKGLVVVPDVSCVTSFTSKTVQTKYEFAKSLSVSASVSGGGWGVSFSASAGYKESSSVVSTGESVFIFSTAKCVYYFSKLLENTPPRFSDSFIKSIYRLNSTDTKTVYMDFFEKYGTHFLSYVTFGARYTFEHKMNAKTYQSERSKGVNVAVQASYSGLFSVGGGFSMDSSQKEAASDFSKNVETKTITVGAPPPANGDAMTWASTVKESPVPMEYKLVSIEELFTEKYMSNLNVNYLNIAKNIDKFKFEYCKYLLDIGQVDSCASLTPGIVLTKSVLYGSYKSKILSYAECIEHCLEDMYCESIDYCKTCTDRHEQVCYMNRYIPPFYEPYGDAHEKWETIIFPTKIWNHFKFRNTNVIGFDRESDDTAACISSMAKCKSFCVKDPHCVAFTFKEICQGNSKNCYLYSENRITGLKKDTGTDVYFISHRESDENSKLSTTSSK